MSQKNHFGRHFGSLGAFFRQHLIFWLKTMSFQYGVTTNFNGADWPTVEGARAILVDLVVFRCELRVSTICRPARRGPYLGRQLDFLKNSFSGGCLGTIPGGDTHFQAPGVTGGCFIREKPRKISFFTRCEALLSTANPNLGQILIFFGSY